MDYKLFYNEFTKLLYNIAKRDDKTKEFEIEKFHKFVKKELINLENDEYGLDNAVYTEFDFEWQQEEEEDMLKAYQTFIDFIQKNKKSVNKKLKNLILDVVIKVADSYKGTEVTEKKIVEKLKEELEKI